MVVWRGESLVYGIDVICEEPLIYGVGKGKYVVRCLETHIRQYKYRRGYDRHSNWQNWLVRVYTTTRFL